MVHWSQFSPDNTRGSLWVSLLVFILFLAGLYLNNKKKWLPLPGWRPMTKLIGLSLVLTLITCPFTTIVPALIPHSTLTLAVIFGVSWLLIKRYSLIILLPLMLIGLLEHGAYIQYKTVLNSMVLTEAYNCSKEELLVYATIPNISLIILSCFILGGVGYAAARILRTIDKKSLLSSSICLLAIMGIFFPMIPTSCPSCSRISVPGTYKRITKAVKETLKASDATAKELEALPSPAEKPSSLPTLKGDEGCVIVLHMGESIRADRLGFNGYPRNTTPNLSQEPRLITWKHCISSAGATVPSLPVILTNGRRSNNHDGTEDPAMMATCGSVMYLFKANGFAMHSFFGSLNNQSIRADQVLRVLVKASDVKHYTGGDVQDSVKQIQECLQTTGKQNVFILINNEGSHAPFSMYDQKNPPFQPSMHTFQAASSHEEAVRNAYDNTIHYTDKFVHNVLQVLKGRPFVYLYVSDHGEYLGDYGGTWGRGRVGSESGFYHSTQASAVGAFAICSQEYEDMHPNFRKAAEQLKSTTSMTIGHEHIFHTLLGLVGMQSPYYIAELDLCSPQVQEYTGPQPSDWPDYLKLDK